MRARQNVIPMLDHAVSRSPSEFRFDLQGHKPAPYATRTTPPSGIPARTQLLVRSVGGILILAGLTAGLAVLLEGYCLYREPVRIEVFALAVEQSSNLDQVLATANHHAYVQEHDLRLSYFAAWVIVMALLFMISTIAFTAIRTGADLIHTPRQRV